MRFGFLNRVYFVCFLLTLCLLGSVTHATPIPANQAFVFSVNRVDPNTFILNWNIKPGYFLYAKRIKLDNQNPSLIHLADLRFPKAINKSDKLGQVEAIYRNHLALPVSVLATGSGDALLSVQYQGCSDEGYCYPPVRMMLKLNFDATHELSNVALDAPDRLQTKMADSTQSLNQLLNQSYWPVTLLGFYVLGLLLAFTPCVLPMVPVLSGLIVGHGGELSTRKAFLLSLSYVVSMSITYALIGGVVAMLGQNLQILMQSTWVISCFALIFVLLALSMFGLFDLKLPEAVQLKIAQFSRVHATGHYLGAALMGALSILILSPCVSPPLIAVLSYIAETGALFLGSVSLFFLGLGMGTPLLIVAVSAGRYLPKAGAWMNVIKAFFGVLMLALAIYLMGRVLPAVILMLLWATLFVMTGIFLGAFEAAPSSFLKCTKGLGIILLSYGLFILLGASLGHEDPFQPLKSKTMNRGQVPQSSNILLKSMDEVNHAIQQALGKPVMLDFYASWCASCKVLEATTLNDPAVLTLLKDFVVLKVDVTENNAHTQALLSHYHVIAPPTFLFLSAQGHLVDKRLIGDVSVGQFQQTLAEVLALN